MALKYRVTGSVLKKPFLFSGCYSLQSREKNPKKESKFERIKTSKVHRLNSKEDKIFIQNERSLSVTYQTIIIALSAGQLSHFFNRFWIR